MALHIPHETIAKRAQQLSQHYHIFTRTDVENWLMAEQQLLCEIKGQIVSKRAGRRFRRFWRNIFYAVASVIVY